MKPTRLIWRGMAGHAFRSAAVFLCAALVACLALLATLVVRGAESQLETSLAHLGADVIVLPWGTMKTTELQGARLLSIQTRHWMPRAYMARIGGVEGVRDMTPQLYVTTLAESPYAGGEDLFLVAYEPETDFALLPWKGPEAVRPGPGEVVVGALVTEGVGATIDVLGTPLRIVSRLNPTGGDLDQALLVTFDTAEAIVSAEHIDPREVKLAPDSITAVLLTVDPGSDAHQVAVRILEQVPGALPIESSDLFQTERAHMLGLLRSALVMLGVIWVLAIVFVGLIYAMVANERSREIGVLRSLGASQGFVLRMLLAESALLGLGGGVLGAALTIAVVAAGGGQMVEALGLPVAVPSAASMARLALAGLALALATITAAAAGPAVRLSRREVAMVMRE